MYGLPKWVLRKNMAGDDFWWILSQNEKADPSFFFRTD